MGSYPAFGVFSTADDQRSRWSLPRRSPNSIEMLSSGHRVNHSAQDVAAMAIATGMGTDIQGFVRGMANVYDGLSMVETADGALGATSERLGRMRELAMAAANGVVNPTQREALNTEYQALAVEIDRTAAATQFNGHRLLDGSAGQVEVVVGQMSESGLETITMDFSSARDVEALGLARVNLAGANGDNALSGLGKLTQALATVSQYRAQLGGVARRLQSAHQALAGALENTSGAQSRLIDTDYAAAVSSLAHR